jgi:uncharacterized protein with FMN-binding domain
MKKPLTFLTLLILIILILSSSFYTGSARNSGEKIAPDTLIKYKDGIYDGQSQDTYFYEPYWGNVRITIKDGMFAGIRFMIRDSNLHETFTPKYRKHFKGNDEYIQQVKNDWKGVQTYPKMLMKTQDLKKLDAITGATWSYNLFRASTEEALKKAGK